MYIDDPVLRERVVFTNKSNFKSIWKILFSIIILTISFLAGAYFFGEQAKVILDQLITTESSTSDASNTPTASETSSSSITEVNTVTPAENIVSKPEIVSDNTTTKPIMVVPIDSAPIESNQNNTVSQPTVAPVVMPTTIVVPSKMIATVEAQNQNETALFKQAKKQLQKKRFTTPQGDNAYETYQILLNKNPQQAQVILNEIIEWYFNRAQQYIKKGRILYPKARSTAYKMYQKLLDIAPEHQKTLILLDDILSPLVQYAQKQIKKDWKQFDKALATLQVLEEIAPEHVKTNKLKQKLISHLFSQAKNQISQEKFTTPKNDNATATYQVILTISPDNVKAKTGIQKIATEYYQLAYRTKRKKDYVSSMTWIKKGLAVMPDDPKLNQLKEEVERKLAGK